MPSARILLAHTTVLAALDTLVTAKHAQVRKLERIMTIENTEQKLTRLQALPFLRGLFSLAKLKTACSISRNRTAKQEV